MFSTKKHGSISVRPKNIAIILITMTFPMVYFIARSWYCTKNPNLGSKWTYFLRLGAICYIPQCGGARMNHPTCSRAQGLGSQPSMSNTSGRTYLFIFFKWEQEATQKNLQTNGNIDVFIPTFARPSMVSKFPYLNLLETPQDTQTHLITLPRGKPPLTNRSHIFMLLIKH